MVYTGKIFGLPFSFPFLLPPAEQRVRLAVNERRREYNEEQRDEYENYVEEERDGKTWMEHNINSCFWEKIEK